MSGFWGGDTESMAEQSRNLERRSGDLLALRTALDSVVRQEQAWQGPDADAFRAQWSGGAQAELLRLGEQLRTLGEELRGHVTEQDAASAPAAGGGAPIGGYVGGAVPTSVGSTGIGSVPGDLLANESSVDTSEASGDYDYDKHYDFDLGDEGPTYSGEMLWRLALSDFSSVFPIPGMPNNPQVGDQFDLAFNPVEVVDVGERSLTLESLPGHIEGEGNLIVFTISEDGTSLDVEARGPDGTWFPNFLPDIFWPQLADNLADLHDVSIMAPGPDYYASDDPVHVV